MENSKSIIYFLFCSRDIFPKTLRAISLGLIQSLDQIAKQVELSRATLELQVCKISSTARIPKLDPSALKRFGKFSLDLTSSDMTCPYLICSDMTCPDLILTNLICLRLAFHNLNNSNKI